MRERSPVDARSLPSFNHPVVAHRKSPSVSPHTLKINGEQPLLFYS